MMSTRLPLIQNRCVCLWLVLALIVPTPGMAFNDTELLLELLREGIANAPRVEVARSRTEQARVNVQSAQWQLWPTPSVSVERVDSSDTDVNYSGDDMVTIWRLQQPLWTAGRLSADLDQAQAQLDASFASLGEAQLQLALDIVSAYSQWLSAWYRYEVWQRSVKEHQRLRDKIARRVVAGASSRNDLELANERIKLVQADVALARVSRETALLQLGQLLGDPVTENRLTQRLPQDLPSEIDIATALVEAEQTSPSLRRVMEETRVAKALIRSRKADNWPELFVRLEHQKGNFARSGAGSDYRVFLGLQSRFGAGFSTMSQVDEAQAILASAEAQVRATHLAIKEQVRNSYAVLQASQKRVAIIKQVVASAQLIQASYERQFLAGSKSWLDLMNASRELATSEVQLADADSAQLSASWRLYIYTKGLSGL